MDSSNIPSISTQRARLLSFKQVEAWGATGDAQKYELERIAFEIQRTMLKSSSPAKAMSAAMRRLKGFFSNCEVRGEVQLLNGRHIKFRLAFPTAQGDGLVFCVIHGEINTRSSTFKFDQTSPIQLSLHALQRLFERLDDHSDASVLDEIYSCIGLVSPWRMGAAEAEAKCWPIISKNGFFIGANGLTPQATVVVTWIRGSQIGSKWGLPLRNLNLLKESHAERMEDAEFAREFVRSFPWMLHEHAPNEDLFALAIEQREDEEAESSQAEQSWDNGPELDASSDSRSALKRSTSYVPGLNYKVQPPPFKTHTLHQGVVVQKRDDGRLVVGLNNGWVGMVPPKSIQRGIDLIPSYEAPEVGQKLAFVVHKITHFIDEIAYSVSLDPEEISHAGWVETEKIHPIGSTMEASVFAAYKQEFMVQLKSGVWGVLPVIEVNKYLNQPAQVGRSAIGLELQVEVKGYREDKKCLLLSISGIEQMAPHQPRVVVSRPGDEVTGKCVRKLTSWVILEMPDRSNGLLHLKNNWGNDLPEVGAELRVIVIDIDLVSGQMLLAGKAPKSVTRPFYAMTSSDELWNAFIEHHSISDIVEVQVLYWRESRHCYLVVTSTGIMGKLPASEVDWMCVTTEEKRLLLKPGDMFNAKILKIDPKNKKVVFSRKALTSNPTDSHIASIQINSEAIGMVVNVTGFGCFLQLSGTGVQGLLHRSKYREGDNFVKGNLIKVKIDSVDPLKGHVSLSISTTTLQDALTPVSACLQAQGGRT